MKSIPEILDSWRRRDSFATAALGGIVASNSHNSPSALARQAYSIADAMLLESESRAPAPAPGIDGAKETQRLDWILAKFANGATAFEGFWEALIDILASELVGVRQYSRERAELLVAQFRCERCRHWTRDDIDKAIEHARPTSQ